jgi:hypothetical protein
MSGAFTRHLEFGSLIASSHDKTSEQLPLRQIGSDDAMTPEAGKLSDWATISVDTFVPSGMEGPAFALHIQFHSLPGNSVFHSTR